MRMRCTPANMTDPQEDRARRCYSARKMRVHFARPRSIPYSSVPTMVGVLAAQKPPLRHVGVKDPALADVIVFPDCHLLAKDWKLTEIARSEVALQFPKKVAVYDERDTPWCRFPGIYVSMPADGFAPSWQVAGSYFSIEDVADRLPTDPLSVEQDLLFSFVGGRTHPCRDAIYTLSGDRVHVEASPGFVFYDSSSLLFDERRRQFAEVMFRSKFFLCPRGTGTSSIRLYETLSAGRVPVIIADAWVPPAGPRWDDFSLRWPEARIAELPAYLAAREGDAEEMGLLAREAYQRWFAPDVSLAHQLDMLGGLLGSGGFDRFPPGGMRNRQYRRAGRAKASARYYSAKGRLGGLLRR